MRFLKDAIHFENLAEFEQFTRLIGCEVKLLNAKTSTLILANDIYNEQNALLSPAGSPIDAELFGKLNTFTNSRRSNKLEIQIKKSSEIAAKLLDIVRSTVIVQFYNARILPKVGRNIFKRCENQLMDIIKDVFRNSQITYSYFNDNCIHLHPNHEFRGFEIEITNSIVKGMFSVGIELDSSGDIFDDYLPSLFITHFILALTRLEVREKLEFNATGEDYDEFVEHFLDETGGILAIDPEIITAAKYLLTEKQLQSEGFYFNNMAVRLKQNVGLVDQFFSLIAGNDFEKTTVNDAIAKLYAACHVGKLHSESLEKLTKWLKKPSLYRMNKMLKTLEGMCNRGPRGTSNAIDYPRHGSGVPTMFICSKNDSECPHISLAYRRINVSRNVDELQAGTYTKCQLLTEALHKYYQKDLANIKQEQSKVV